MSIPITSRAFTDGKAIPVRFTQDGEGVSPQLSWGDVPAGTKELALICDDPNAPRPTPCVHWVIYKIPPDVHELHEQMPRQATLGGMRQGLNYLRHPGYDGPAPPKGHGLHHYHFKLYALDKYLEPTDAVDGRAFYTAIAGHVLDEGEIVGTYERA
jgi:hypothetical protein